MDWVTLASIVLGEGLLAFIIGIVTIRSTKKKAEAEAKLALAEAEKAKVEADNAAVAPMRDALEMLRQQLLDSGQREAEKDATIERLREEKDDLIGQASSVKATMCVHMGCALRDPLLGQGDQWYETHKNDPTLGVDYLPFTTLMKRYREEGRIRENELEKDE